jgi:hypothetical protein
MVPGKRIGRNNLCVLRGDLSKGGPMALEAEGHKDYLPLGPRGFFIRGGEAVEQRIPRKPLGLEKGRIFIRAIVTYRDQQRGTGNWSNATFPAGGQWIGLDLALPPPPDLAADISTVNRAIEPVMVRDALGAVRSSPSSRLMSHYIYPVATPAPFVPQVVKRAEEEQKPTPARAVQPAIVVGPSGEVIDPATGAPVMESPVDPSVLDLLLNRDPSAAPNPNAPPAAGPGALPNPTVAPGAAPNPAAPPAGSPTPTPIPTPGPNTAPPANAVPPPQQP